MKRSLSVIAIVFFILQEPEMVQGADIDRIVAILAAIKNRQDSYNPVDVRYRIKRTYTKYYFASAQKIDPADRRLFSTLNDATVVSHGQYSTKGDRLRVAVEAPSISADGKIGEGTHGANVYDGTLFKTTGDDGKVVSVSRKKPNYRNPLSEYNGEFTLISNPRIVKGAFEPAALTIKDNPGQVPSAALYFRMVFGKGDQESALDVWVSSAEKGYCVLRSEHRLGGKLFHEYSDCEYKQVDGIWYLSKSLYRNYYHNKNIHQLAKEDRFEVERITFRADEIPDSQFVIPVANDTELIDRDRNNLRIVGTDKVDKHIQEAVADVERERTGGGWLPWVYASVSVLLLIGAFYLAARIVLARRKGKSATT
jgi:hypothetical protein